MTIPNTLNHSTTLRVFLYLKNSEDEEHSIREVQRKLNLKSPNSVTWHFNKLIDAGLLTQLPHNAYVLTDYGKKINEFEIPVVIKVKLRSGILVPEFAFLLSFFLSSILTALIIYLFQRDPNYLIFTGIAVILISSIIIIRIVRLYQKSLSQYLES